MIPAGEDEVYSGKFIQVTEENIEGVIYERAYINDALTIFPIDDNGRVILIKEYRVHENPKVRWKPVTGFDENEYSFNENVDRELQEELGLKAVKIQHYFEIKQTGTINMTHFFAIASKLTPSKLPNPDGEETILEISAIDIEEVFERTLSGELVRGSSGYGLLKLYYDLKKGVITT